MDRFHQFYHKEKKGKLIWSLRLNLRTSDTIQKQTKQNKMLTKLIYIGI